MITLYPEPPLVLEERLMPLYLAMKKDQRIKSVTCINADKRFYKTGEFQIENFEALYYFNSVLDSEDHIKQNYVQTDKGNFYMEWVKEFEL